MKTQEHWVHNEQWWCSTHVRALRCKETSCEKPVLDKQWKPFLVEWTMKIFRYRKCRLKIPVLNFPRIPSVEKTEYFKRNYFANQKLMELKSRRYPSEYFNLGCALFAGIVNYKLGKRQSPKQQEDLGFTSKMLAHAKTKLVTNCYSFFPLQHDHYTIDGACSGMPLFVQQVAG